MLIVRCKITKSSRYNKIMAELFGGLRIFSYLCDIKRNINSGFRASRACGGGLGRG